MQLDNYGGCSNSGIMGVANGTFHLEKIKGRWWMITPDGNVMFVSAISKVDTSDYGGSGGFLHYDAVYLNVLRNYSGNLRNEAENSNIKDIVHTTINASLSFVNDEIYLGDNSIPYYTYFWLDQLGLDGKIKWYYSSSAGWKLINGTGNPFKGEKLNGDNSYNMDIGNYMAPDVNGFGVWGNIKANRINWWNVVPLDFIQISIPNDTVERFYIKGVVTKDFTTPPILNQVYERSGLSDSVIKKYGTYKKWSENITLRLKSWGFNASGQYSYRYWQQNGSLPIEPTWQLSGLAMRQDYPYKVKSVYKGAVFPPKSSKLIWQGLQADIFDPVYKTALMEKTASFYPMKNSQSYILIPEEADYLFGINSTGHDHLGYVIISQNPFQSGYDRPELYSKYALRDFLRYKFRDMNDNIAPFTIECDVPFYSYNTQTEMEINALQNLNAQFGTNYTTWGTSSGDMTYGTNAWGTGTGFMDEDGAKIIYPGKTAIAFSKDFTNPNYPEVRKSLDDFVAFFAAKYGKILSDALKQGSHPSVFLPLYKSPDYVYNAISPYVDGFWVSISGTQDAKNIYNASKKPILIADYNVANKDSPLYEEGIISSVFYDALTKRTRINVPGIRYPFRTSQLATFPDNNNLTLRLVNVKWDTLVVSGDYSKKLITGQRVIISRTPVSMDSQEKRADTITQLYDSLLNVRGDDGTFFVMGFEHWSLYDNEVSNWMEIGNFGIITASDNAYDGMEAKCNTGKDSRGFITGGEEKDYGNLLGHLSEYLLKIYLHILLTDDTSPSTPIVKDSGLYTIDRTSLKANWSASDAESGIAEYQYAIGTSKGAVDVIKWTSAGINTSIIQQGLSLKTGQKYYFSVKAINSAGLVSSIGYSDGIIYGINRTSLWYKVKSNKKTNLIYVEKTVLKTGKGKK